MSKLFDFEGERALILGAGGIGGSIAVELAERGADIVIADISQANLDKVQKQIEAVGGHARSIQTNITNRDDVVKLYEKVQEILPNITLSVNSIGLNVQAPAVDTTEEQWDTVINGFLNNLFWSNQKGKILNLASM